MPELELRAERLAHACPVCNGCVNLDAGVCDGCGVTLPGVRRPPLELVPVTREQAQRFVREHHRHNRPGKGDVLRVGLELDGELVAVGVAGRPVAPGLQDGRTLEITRLCTVGHENACSRLYGALCRAARALGWRRVVTYTLASEPGSSLLASGFERVAETPARDWALESGRPRYTENLFGESEYDPQPRVRWERLLTPARARS